MSDEKKKINWLWPEITNLESAIEASKYGYWASLWVAGITAVAAIASLFIDNPLGKLPIDASALLDAAIFAFIGWRIKHYSRAFATAGLVIFVISKLMMIAVIPVYSWIMAIILIRMFATGVQGVFAYHKLSNQNTSRVATTATVFPVVSTVAPSPALPPTTGPTQDTENKEKLS